MSETEARNTVGELLAGRLREAGLSDFINRGQSQFLDMEQEGFFVELVLNDATELETAEEIVRQATDELRPRGIPLESVVRALWETVEVSHVGPARDSSGGLRAASTFRVVLKSGAREHQVAVEVSLAARYELQRRSGVAESRQEERMIADGVRRFIDRELSRGGTGYWDPLREPRLHVPEHFLWN